MQRAIPLRVKEWLDVKRSNWASVVLSVVMALAVGIVGVFAVGWVVRLQIKNASAQWCSLGTPPERAVSFVGLYPHVNDSRDVDVYVETESGAVYRYACCSHPQAAWRKAQVTEELWPGSCDRDDPGEIVPRPALARLPTKVIACEEILWDKNPPDTSYFVLLDDHSVWWWREYVDLGMIVVWLLAGFGVGAGIGVWLAVILKRQRVRRLRSV
jgi:hypothetical protein